MEHSLDEALSGLGALIMDVIAHLVSLEDVCKGVAHRRAWWLSRRNEARANDLDDAIFQASLRALSLTRFLSAHESSLTPSQRRQYHEFSDALDRLTDRWHAFTVRMHAAKQARAVSLALTSRRA